MKYLINKFNSLQPQTLVKVEFWLATAAFILSLISIVGEDGVTIVDDGRSVFQPGPFFQHAFLYAILYCGFVALNFFSLPAFIRRENVLIHIGIIVVLFIVAGLLFRNFDIAIIPFSLFAVYSIIRYSGIYLWRQSAAIYARYKFITPGVLVATIIWLLSLLLFVVGDADVEVIAAWVTLIPQAILIHSVSFHWFIPKAKQSRRPVISFLARTLVILAVATLPWAVLIYQLTGNEDAPAMITIANWFFQLLVTAPLSWMLFNRYHKGQQEVITLQKELGQSVASIDFLRSQINPHFLFNALNTLYGTALNEKAERTAEGVQKLGDMMRFMLQENMQPLIPISREIDYLRDYLALQKLRIDNNPTIRVETSIADISAGSIAPMLLIPFVENAFKHGISFREPSHIRITLATQGGSLLFDVYNSKHAKPAHDPEADRNGIGLTNVKQRLELLYPGKYELAIRETPMEYFVHLTIHLSLPDTI